MSGEQMQARIAAARRDAEGLKDRIKRKKDELLDTSCKYPGCFEREFWAICYAIHMLGCYSIAADGVIPSTHLGSESHRASTPNRHEVSKSPQRPSCKNIRHALVYRSKTSCLSFTRRQAHYLGRIYHQQSPRYPTPIFLGHDLRVCSKWELCGLWWPRQYLLSIQSFVTWRSHSCCPRAVGPLWLSLLLSVHQRSTYTDLFRRYDLYALGCRDRV